ncbi:MAG: DUF11 domain-containing protein, partial [Verrucomicrobiota bacterium]
MITYVYDRNGNLLERLTQTSPATSADLVVMKANDGPVNLGDVAVFTLTVTNRGPNPARDVRLIDELPSGFMAERFNTTVGVCSQVAGQVVCDLGVMPVHGTAVVTMYGTPQVAGGLTNIIQVSASNELDNLDNMATNVLLVHPVVDLVLENIATPEPVVATYSLTTHLYVSNAGPSAASGVVVTSQVPAGVTLISATPSQGACVTRGNEVVCHLGLLAVGAGAGVTLVGEPQSVGLFTNRTTVSAIETEAEASDNIATAITTVEAEHLVVVNTNDAGPGSLRAAILLANVGPAGCVIAFDIPGPGIPRIAPLTALPLITNSMTIDGLTQSNGMVELNGAETPAGTHGLSMSGSVISVRGLVINRFPGDGIHLEGANVPHESLSNRF